MSANQDLEAIRSLEAAYDAAWSKGDVAALLECFAEDAVLVNPRDEVAIGRDEIRDQIGRFLEGSARHSRHSSDIVRISFPTPDVAVVDGEARLEGGSALGSLTHRFTDVVVRRDGRWQIAHVRAYALEVRSAGA